MALPTAQPFITLLGRKVKRGPRVSSLKQKAVSQRLLSFFFKIFFFFFMWTIFKVFIKFVTVLLLSYVLVFWPRSMWDVSSSTRA